VGEVAQVVPLPVRSHFDAGSDSVAIGVVALSKKAGLRKDFELTEGDEVSGSIEVRMG
jgi:hypothetical protein